jgi:hypothetical protein
MSQYNKKTMMQNSKMKMNLMMKKIFIVKFVIKNLNLINNFKIILIQNNIKRIKKIYLEKLLQKMNKKILINNNKNLKNNNKKIKKSRNKKKKSY